MTLVLDTGALIQMEGLPHHLCQIGGLYFV